MQQINEFLLELDKHIGGGPWFVYLLLGTGLFFTIYLGFPQIRYFKHAFRIVRGKYDKHDDVGDTSHFQALTTALSGTVGTGNIAGVALAIHLGGPAALFWMLVTAMLGMTTKFVEVTISHKYRDILPDGSISGGPMYYMKKRLNIKTKSGKLIKTGVWLGGFFAFATILSSFGTGSLPQINSISDSLFDTFGINKVITGAVLAVLLGAVIIGGIKRIARVTATLVPAMALIYFLGAMFVIITNYENIIPSFLSIFSDAFTGSAAVGGFLGAGFAFSFNKGVNRGLFSNEAGQGSAPIAHSAAKAHEPVSEGMVAILEPFIDTIIICSLTGMVLLSSGVWSEKFDNQFEDADLRVFSGQLDESSQEDVKSVRSYFKRSNTEFLFSGALMVEEGELEGDVTIIHAQSFAENVKFTNNNVAYTGPVYFKNGEIIRDSTKSVQIWGKSLIHSAPLTTQAFNRSFLGNYGQYIVSIGLLLFAFSTAISWSYYGGRAVTYLFGSRWDIVYRIFYVIAFFFAAFTDTTIVWNFSLITIAIMTVPNLIGILILHKDIKSTIHSYWDDFRDNWPDAKVPRKYR
ncbi:MAG: sodium:alanine symporter family protein [Bacteroidales bacterium]|nr:sodium:alanine symporter family protein [Bacteroidales bacterium]MCF8389456.1 sodium:alanine symporter family protein [Bacteroidales bacterium]